MGKTDKKSHSRKRAIGLLGHEPLFEMPVTIFHAAREFAQKHDILLYYITAQPLQINKDYYYESNILYNFISRDVLDGLVLMSNLLLTFVSIEEFMNKCSQYEGLPMVSIGLALPDTTSVLLDNERGVYMATNHLIEKHHYNRIGFLRGPLQHPEARLRFQAYTRAMQEHNLPVKESLLLNGDFQPRSGLAAVAELIDKRQQIPGRDIDALICANDYMAMNAYTELTERGYRIPEDIAVVGFDDVVFSKCLVPSLSSIPHPIEAMTVRAFELIMEILDGKQVPESVIIPTEFIPRSSCGCRQQYLSDIKLQLITTDPEAHEQPGHIFSLKHINKLINTNRAPNIHVWQNALMLLQDYNPDAEKSGNHNPTEDFKNLVIPIIGNTVENFLSKGNIESQMQNLRVYLSSTLDLSKLLEILITRLPGLGIQRCYINFYEDSLTCSVPDKLPLWSRLIMAFHKQDDGVVKEELPPGGLRFHTSELIPKELQEKYGQESWILAALHFERVQIGFLLLDYQAFDVALSYNLRLQLSSSLNGVLLLKGYKEHSQKLADANARIHEFNKQLEDENLRIKTEMEVARSIQTALLPHDVRHIHPDFEISSLMIPTEEVGGDYFDIALDEQKNLWIGIGDVSGHGLKAGMIMMIAQSAHTTVMANFNVTPRDVIIAMNRALFRNVTNRMKQNQYMTCAILKYLEQGRFQYAGMHPYFLVYRQKQQICEEVILNGIWLNINPDIDDITLNFEFKMDIGDVLVLYTDGITEVSDKNGELLDINGLKEIIPYHGEKNIDEMLQAIKDDVLAFSTGANKDDMSLVLIRRIR